MGFVAGNLGKSTVSLNDRFLLPALGFCVAGQPNPSEQPIGSYNQA